MVDMHLARPDLPRYVSCTIGIARLDMTAQPRDRIVGDHERFLDARIRKDAEDSTEYFLLRDAHIGPYVRKDCRPGEPALIEPFRSAGSAAKELGPFFDADRDHALN